MPEVMIQLPKFIAAQYPFTRRMVDTTHGRVHVATQGNPEHVTALMLHGNPTWSFLWRKVISGLETSDVYCVAPDLLGFGLSDKPRNLGFHTLAIHIETITEVVQALGLSHVILVGQDWGGPILTGVAANLPERILGAVFGNTAVVLPNTPKLTAFHRLGNLPVVSNLLFQLFAFPLPYLNRVQGDRWSITGKVRLAYFWPFRHIVDRAGPLGLTRMVPGHADHPSLPALRRGQTWLESYLGPVHLVWGKNDPILGNALKRHKLKLPNAYVTETSAGHFLQEEVPFDMVNAVRDVLVRAK
ncbi:MAG: alpha/beta fold hydrolase [Myxococcales bacterium]|nr:alpha/beta fold hydrolase [Myxococcales bacterium]